MARIGLAYSVYAPITTEAPGDPIVYGTPKIFTRPIEANIAYERADAPLYGGDVVAENDNSIAGGTLSFNNTHLIPAERAALLGDVLTGTLPNDYYVVTGLPSPYGGFGYVTSEIESNVKKYYAYWIYKTQFALNEDKAKTKTEKTEWQTPTVEGAIMGVFVDNTGNAAYVAYQSFATYALAKAWVDTLAGVTTAATSTATPAAGAVASGATVALASATAGAAIHYTVNGSIPTPSSTLYSAPIAITAPVTIKAIAVKSGMNNSAVLSAAYTVI